MQISEIWNQWKDAEVFSGVFSAGDAQGVQFEKVCGYRNRSEGLPNARDTAFGIASGTKLFTALAVCRLMDEGRLALHDTVRDIVPHDLGEVDPRVSVYHLLTHTSGIGDYLDEEAPNAYEKSRELCNRYPVYLWERLAYYLPMIAPLPPKFEPGFRFGYSNAGFILLGLVIEAAGGMPYQRYVTENIIAPCGLRHTGFYRADELPANTALGYIQGGRTNIFSLPVIGGADGGLYTCADDLSALWQAVWSGRLFSSKMLGAFTKEHVKRSDSKGYGLGVYRHGHGENTVYYAVGGDFGVDFFTAYCPEHGLTASALGNTETNTFPLLAGVLEEWGSRPTAYDGLA